MILTKVEMMSAPGKTFMLTANAANANLQPKTQARIQQNALKTVRFAECGLFA